ncbi:hypothetical protein BEWA_046420 [Theileria equi strain WA]|uniref:Uncharacterized protein n=1 Tax=Theileria equi strain WA TaxID=1537102 RepID=L1LAI4_THEEQ|nr:hypothetical protein BEWA_046420 [Theileria equi strain WA]EKX72178.1 hypothetical protein BEWA_046420 [Theileria equi strain WA]|eukprot:XP_004831630.1 hypothetical protein BEWA_046420 [Theileria equi strain WA]
MDLKDLDSQKFMIDGEESDKMASGLVVPKLEYRVPKVTYGDFTLWESENGWECTHADVYVSAENIIIVLGLENGSESGYKAQLKLADREWQEIEMFEVNRLLFDIVIMDIDERNLRGRFLRHA